MLNGTRTRRSIACALVLAAVAAIGLFGPLSVAQAKPCGSITVRGFTYTVGGSDGRPKCRFMRNSAKRWIRADNEPKGWNCRRSSRRSGGCDKKRSDKFFIYYPPD